MSSRVPLIFGAAGFGKHSTNTGQIHMLADCQELVDLFVGRGYRAFDTSRFYSSGTSEEYIGKLDLKACTVDTKCLPSTRGDHSPEKLRASVQASLKALSPYKIRIFYLHAPDRSVPFEDTLRCVDEMHKEGLFEEFGLSNFFSYEVAELVTLGKANGWVQPTVYQGLYNAIERTVEYELIPCLRKYNIRFYAYSPLAGGILTGEILSQTDMQNRGATAPRWNKETGPGEYYQSIWMPILPLLKPLKEELEKHSLTLGETAQRWLQHHSALIPDDAVVLGASKVKQLATNLDDSEKGPLPADVVELLDEAWLKAKPYGTYYAD